MVVEFGVMDCLDVGRILPFESRGQGQKKPQIAPGRTASSRFRSVSLPREETPSHFGLAFGLRLLCLLRQILSL